jgi:hypothetical protein
MFSWVALDRFAEKERTRDATFRKQSAGKVLRSDAQPLTDDDLLAKLRSFGIELDRPALERLCREALSAEEMATPWLDQRTFHGTSGDGKRLDLGLLDGVMAALVSGPTLFRVPG